MTCKHEKSSLYGALYLEGEDFRQYVKHGSGEDGSLQVTVVHSDGSIDTLQHDGKGSVLVEAVEV